LLIGSFYAIVTPGGMGALVNIIHMKDEIKESFGKLFTNSIIKMATNSTSRYITVLVLAFAVLQQYPLIFLGIIGYIA